MPAATSKLIVEESTNDDTSVAHLSPSAETELELFRGDTILLTGSKGKSTVCIAIFDDACSAGRIRLNKTARRNLRVRVGDTIEVSHLQDIQYGRRIEVLPFDDTVTRVTDELVDAYLKPYFQDAYRPVKKGDTFICQGPMRAVEFKVVEMDPPGDACIVAPATVLQCKGKPIQREEEDRHFEA
jgi:transitional endoplasmic reticulum ATPase